MAERRTTVFILLGMIVWVAAAVIGTLAIWGALMLVSRELAIGSPGPGRLNYVLFGAFGFQGILLIGALWQGRRNRSGGGLGVRPIVHKGWIALCCLAMLGWLTGVIALSAAIPLVRDFMKSMTPEFLLSDLGGASPWVVALLVILTVILAPVAEELFFRGWLWEALRQRGHGFVATACQTAIPWLLLHGIQSPGRILFLLPAAVVFSVARYAGGSVLASLTVHVTNNLGVVLVQMLAAILAHG